MKPNIQIKLRHYPGYGTPPSWEVRAIYNNRRLEEVLCRSEYQQGQVAAELRMKWEKEWDEKEFQQVVDSKPLASPWCSICGKDTLDGGSSCVEKIFCKNCQHLIPQYQAEWREEVRKREQKYADEEAQRKRDNQNQVQSAIAGAFHWQHNWFWKRLPDGGVRVMRLDGEYLIPDLVIPPNEWASIVASVSATGETGETWKAALDFHNKQVRELTI